jgi:chromosome segregation ATPase
MALQTQLLSKDQEIKNSLAEKNEAIKKYNQLKLDMDKLTKKLQAESDTSNSSLKELEETQNALSNVIKEKDHLKHVVTALEKSNLGLNKEIEDLNAKLSDVQLDFEIKNEEYEALRLELENSRENMLSQSIANLDPESAGVRVLELETQVQKLSQALIKLTDEKNLESNYFKKQIDEYKEKLKGLDELNIKEDIINKQKRQLDEYESALHELKEQLAVFTNAGNILDELILQKTDLELELNKEMAEKEEMRQELETADQLIQEMESSSKITQDIIRDKEDAIIKLTNSVNIYKNSLEEFETKEKQLVNIITNCKNENKVMREELAKNKGSVNIDDIVNKNV